MERQARSPRIVHLSWGHLEVEGYPTFKDAKLYPDGARAWDWRETGTEHAPGIQPADVEELLEHGASVVVLSQGMTGRLQVAPETLQVLKDQGVTAHVLGTEEAVHTYNQLREKEPVGGLFHTTC